MSSRTFDDDTTISDVAQLSEWMRAGSKPRDRWVIGTEHEKQGWWADRAERPTYGGDRGIGALLTALETEAGWVATREGEDIIALGRDRATITLEPGGQLELSGAPLPTLAEMSAELDAHLSEIRAFSERFGITWSGLGYAPSGTPESGPWMPKARYGIMRRYLPTRGTRALEMMAMTATVQANYDFGDEDDAFRKLRVGVGMTPAVIALFANSPIVKGALAPERSARAAVWSDVDPDRCVLPLELTEPGAGFADYVRWALDVPMFFIHRDGGYIDCAGLPFRRFLEAGHEGHHATMGDWELHLSTLFPDVRIKQHLEVRGADMGSANYIRALPALHVGVFYDDEALAAADALFTDIGGERVAAARAAAPAGGFDAQYGDAATVREVSGELLRLARAGLERLEPGAVGMLDILDETLTRGLAQADRVRANWDGDVGALMARTQIC
jgi:glutamate--cysteine ligase